ncbi:MAG TPA: YlxR family protein [Polyangia bacterium]|nr:YlxR family protein [Polyangia bacterium]
MRTCIGCRRRAPAAELVRLVLVDGRPTVDAERRRVGRGASMHPSEACVRAALAKGAFGRAFRRRVVDVAAADLWLEIMAAWGELA